MFVTLHKFVGSLLDAIKPKNTKEITLRRMPSKTIKGDFRLLIARPVGIAANKAIAIPPPWIKPLSIVVKP